MPNSQEFDGYELVATLSSKAQTQVHKARRIGTDDAVVIKTYRDSTRGAGLPGVFTHEVEVRSSLGSLTGLESIIDLGVSTTEIPYIVMLYRPGRVLAEALVESRFSLADTTDLTNTVGSFLTSLHEAGWVHGSLTATDIFLSEAGVLVGGMSGLTVLDSLPPGAPRHGAAPEVAGGEAVTVRADIFGLGALAHRSITGDPPRGLILPPISDPAVPAHVAEAVGRATAADPDGRYDSISDFLQAIHGKSAPQPADRTVSTAPAPDDVADDRTVVLDDALIAQIRAADASAPIPVAPEVPPDDISDETIVVNEDVVRQIRQQASGAVSSPEFDDVTVAADDDLVKAVREPAPEGQGSDVDEDDDETISAGPDLIGEIRAAQADPAYRVKPKVDDVVPRHAAAAASEPVGSVPPTVPVSSTQASEAERLAELRRQFSPEVQQKPQGFLPPWVLIAGGLALAVLIIVVAGIVIVG